MPRPELTGADYEKALVAPPFVSTRGRHPPRGLRGRGAVFVIVVIVDLVVSRRDPVAQYLLQVGFDVAEIDVVFFVIFVIFIVFFVFFVVRLGGGNVVVVVFKDVFVCVLRYVFFETVVGIVAVVIEGVAVFAEAGAFNAPVQAFVPPCGVICNWILNHAHH